MNQQSTKTVKCVYGDTHTVLQSSYDNPKKINLKLIQTSNPNVDLNDGESHYIHRGNIILDDTIGFQITNQNGDCFEHESFEIIESVEKAGKLLTQAICEHPEHTWKSVQISDGTIESPSFV